MNKKKIRTLRILLGLLIVLSGIGGGVYYYLNYVDGDRASASSHLKTYFVINGKQFEYKNIGRDGDNKAQKWIDNNPERNIASWGGKPIQDNDENLNTHFIGHNPGVFRELISMRINSVIEVHDNINPIRNYKVTDILMVDDEGNLIDQVGVNVYEQMVEPGADERITLQACLSDITNIVIVAKPV
ncbi:sortase domain-containing protein [Lactococcus hodotermopsidis]|nr:sortase [Lactococcus hodotermopsidis]